MQKPLVILVMQAVSFTQLASSQSPTMPRFPITRNAVATTLLSAGLAVDDSRIEMPAQMTSSIESPLLEASFAATTSATSFRIRIHCRTTTQCIPFFAQVDLHDPVKAFTAQKLLEAASGTDRSARPARHPSLQPGQQARLLLEDDHMRISIPVLLIDSGIVGTEVRVASLDRKQVYKGTVSDEGIIRGTLP